MGQALTDLIAQCSNREESNIQPWLEKGKRALGG